MKSALVLGCGLATLLGGVVALLIKTIAVDETRGRWRRRLTRDLELIIAELPQEAQESWGDEWRGELDAVLSMPVTALLFVRGIRHFAEELNDKSNAAPALDTPDGRVGARGADKQPSRVHPPVGGIAEWPVPDVVIRDAPRRVEPIPLWRLRVVAAVTQVVLILGIAAWLLSTGDSIAR